LQPWINVKKTNKISLLYCGTGNPASSHSIDFKG
jgi:hypothetical protein